MTTTPRTSISAQDHVPNVRWIQLIAGIVGMIMIANLQYGWTLFVNPLHDSHHWSKAAIQVSFTLFVLVDSWLVPFEAFLADKFGPRVLVFIGGICTALAWVVDAHANSLSMLYLGGIIAGIGAGIVYGTAIGNTLKWFQDRRGFAAGLVAAGFGAGAALTVIPISRTISSHGYQSAFLWFGLGQGLIVLIASLFLRAPRPGEVPPAKKSRVKQSARDLHPAQTVRTPTFWLMYVMFVMVAFGGLMAVAQLSPIAKDFKISKVPVSFIGFTLPALTFALALNNIMNGLTRPFFGWVSDHIGRENTMFIAFILEGIGILTLYSVAHYAALFVIASAFAFFAWGEIYSLFPATSADIFGRKYATTNYGILYTAKGTASLLVPIGNIVHDQTGSWAIVFFVAAAFNFIPALLALFVLKPLHHRVDEELTTRTVRTVPGITGGAE